MSFIDGNKNGLSIETINKPFETQAFRGNNSLNSKKYSVVKFSTT